MENKGAVLDFLDNSDLGLEKFIARKDIKFSNSMVEAANKKAGAAEQAAFLLRRPIFADSQSAGSQPDVCGAYRRPLATAPERRISSLCVRPDRIHRPRRGPSTDFPGEWEE